MAAGGAVMRDTLKNKDKYDKRKAKVERLNVRAAVVTMLEGPAQGEKRNVNYKALEVWPCNSPTKSICRRCFLSLLFLSRQRQLRQRLCCRRRPAHRRRRHTHLHFRRLGYEGLMRSPLDRPFQQCTRTRWK